MHRTTLLADLARLRRLLQEHGWRVIHTQWGPRWYGPGMRSGIGCSEGEALSKARKILKEPSNGKCDSGRS